MEVAWPKCPAWLAKLVDSICIAVALLLRGLVHKKVLLTFAPRMYTHSVLAVPAGNVRCLYVYRTRLKDKLVPKTMPFFSSVNAP